MDLKNHISHLLHESLRELLQNKHLYQGIDLMKGCEDWAISAHQSDTRHRMSPVLGGGRGGGGAAKPIPLDDFKKQYANFASSTSIILQVAGSGVLLGQDDDGCPSAYALPIDAFCPKCKSNPRTYSPHYAVPVHNRTDGSKRQQSWVLGYACAKCGSVLEFYLFRRACHIKICGRYPFETTIVPEDFPEFVREYVAKARVAADTGNTLAGIFFLRVAIEQFFRSLPEVMKACKKLRPSGDELGAAYNRSIPMSLKKGFPSLRDLYSRLSDAIHGANEDALIFESCYKDLLRHFKARALLVEESGDSESPTAPPVAPPSTTD